MAAGEKRKASSSNAPRGESRGSESDARKRLNETNKHKTAAAAADDLATDHSPSELAYLSWLRSAGVRLSGVTIGRS